MEEQNNQHFENQEPKEEITESISNEKKKISKMAIIIGAIAVAVVAIAVVLIVLLGGKSDDEYEHEPCNHYYIEEVENEPTCFANGDKKYECRYCDDIYYDSIPKLTHNWEPATCTSPEKCTHCGSKKNETSVALGHDWMPATCTRQKKCNRCNETEGYSLGHDYSESDGACTRCGFGVTFIVSDTPITVWYYDDAKYEIESINIERTDKHIVGEGECVFTFIVKCVYDKKGDSYSRNGRFAWKLYDEDGMVIDSGSVKTDGSIQVGEKSKVTITFDVGSGNYNSDDLRNGKTYRFEILNIG